MDERRIDVRAERLVAGGDALARLDDGRVAFVTGVLPGELATVRVVDERTDFARAVLASADDVHEASPDRVVPACVHRRAGCGGCGWMHLAAAAQLDAKAEIVAEALRRTGRLETELVDSLVRVGGSVPPVGYRTTIRVTGAPGGGVGYRREGSDDVIGVDGCDVAHERLGELLVGLRVAPGVELSLRTSVATGAITARWEVPRRGRRRRGRTARGRPSTTASGGPERPVNGLPREVHIGDRAFLVERVAGVDLRVSAPSFFQSGPAAAELLVDAVARAAPELARADHAVDAYGGVGLFAATVMRDAAHVTVVESSVSACADAEHNLADCSVEVVRSDVAVWTARPERAVDVVVADPARPGLARPGTAAVAATEAPVVVLVSCDPVSLARDVVLLGEAGYRPESVEVLDLTPQTHHVEAVTRFVRG